MKKSAMAGFVIFMVGAGVGSVLTYFHIKKKMDEVYDEVEYVEEETADNHEEKEDNEEVKESVREILRAPKKEKTVYPSYDDVYRKATEKLGYGKMFKNDEEPEDIHVTKETSVRSAKHPYVITPQEFDEGEFDAVSFTLYADHILADENDEMVEDVDGTVGSDSLTRFGDDDVIYVRNEKLKMDFEIVKDIRRYVEERGRYYRQEE